MKLFEIVEMVDGLITNTIPASTKVSWINLIQNEFYRDYPLPEKTSLFDVKQGQQLYVLPADCPEDRITELTIDNQPYNFIPRGIDIDYTPIVFFTIVTGLLMVYPNPPADVQGVLYYKPSPVQMSTSNMQATPAFPADFHEMLVFGCASRVAKAAKDAKMAAVFETDFQRLAAQSHFAIRRNRPKKVIVSRRWL